jgi:nitroimidazol reductase NimA-like FMN-containing flavoprotein (pyridoxamine 5'-phosphate oxidase superfamily)
MYETPEDLTRLQALLDASHGGAGHHLREVMTADRRLDAAAMTARLDGVNVLALATVTADGRPLVGPVDGLFFRGHWYFGSSPDSVRFRHVRARPAVSAVHTVGEEFAVVTHGEAKEIEIRAWEHTAVREYFVEVYVPTYGADWTDFLDANLVARIDAHKMFNFWNPPAADADHATTVVD